MATGHGAEEDTYTEEVTGQGQELDVHMYVADGYTPAAATHGTEDAGDKNQQLCACSWRY